MRLKVRSLRQVVKGDLPIQFVPQRLTSYGGLELVRRYLGTLAIVGRLRTALAAIPSDYGSARLALLVIGLFYVGARRLEHLQYLVGDPLDRGFHRRTGPVHGIGKVLRNVRSRADGVYRRTLPHRGLA